MLSWKPSLKSNVELVTWLPKVNCIKPPTIFISVLCKHRYSCFFAMVCIVMLVYYIGWGNYLTQIVPTYTLIEWKDEDSSGTVTAGWSKDNSNTVQTSRASTTLIGQWRAADEISWGSKVIVSYSRLYTILYHRLGRLYGVEMASPLHRCENVTFRDEPTILHIDDNYQLHPLN